MRIHRTHYPQAYRHTWANPWTRSITEIAACGTTTFPDWIIKTDIEEELTCQRCVKIMIKREWPVSEAVTI